jgi:DNA helicase-2/ATP-dependent DNA helicase PcrA
MPWDQELEGIYRNIAEETRTPVHVMGGPGTGKTFAMMRRIARLLENGVEPQRILAVTFTRTAARDLSEQLARLGVPGAEEVRAITLHSLCFSGLAREEVFEVTGRIARPLVSYEISQMVNDLARICGGKREAKELLEAYEAGWARMQHDVAGQPQTQQEIDFQASLLNWLRYHRAMLIGELVPLSLAFLRGNPTIHIFPAFDHVLVDEYQDLNKADQTLIHALAQRGSLTVVGDDNQSIYSFRYANPEGIRLFPQENPGTVCYVIEECRRCPPNIVEISNSLICSDQRRLRPIPLHGDHAGQPAVIYIVQHHTLADEVNSIAEFIHKYLQDHPNIPPGQVLVLSPRRFIGHRIRRALIDRGRNALSYFFEDEIKKPIAAEGYCLLQLLVQPDDRAALRAWLGLRNNQGYAGGYARLRAYSQEQGIEPWEALEALDTGEITIPYTSPLLARFRLLKDRLADIRELQGLDLVRRLWDPADEEALDIRLLAERIALETQDPADLFKSLTVSITQPELPDSGADVIRIMSLHKSKGLTASCVVIAGCVAGALPYIDPASSPALQDSQLEEQRRLFYVAITRATDTLIVSSAISMPLRDAMAGSIHIRGRFFVGDLAMARTASTPFLNELGPQAPAPIDTATWRQRAGF